MELRWYRGGWYAYWRDETGTRRVSLRTNNRDAAEQALADIKRQQNRPRDTVIKSLMEAYLKDKPSDTARFSWRALAPFWGPLRADQVSPDLCRSYADRRRDDGRQNGTIIRELGVLKACVKRYASDAGAIFEMPSAPPPKDRYLNKAEFRALRAAADDYPHLVAFLDLAIATGARAGALLGLTWVQVDFDRGTIDLGIGGGNKKRAIVPMTNSLRASLNNARLIRGTVYVIEWNRQPVKSIKKAFGAAVRRAGLDRDVTPHVLRHTAAVWMAEDGVRMEEISQYLGHTSSRITEKVYARYSPEYLRRAASALEI